LECFHGSQKSEKTLLQPIAAADRGDAVFIRLSDRLRRHEPMTLSIRPREKGAWQRPEQGEHSTDRPQGASMFVGFLPTPAQLAQSQRPALSENL